jgi:hypothetical protein
MSDYDFTVADTSEPVEQPTPGERISNHVDLARDRLVEQMKLPKWQLLTEKLCTGVQDLEDALWALFTERFINTAVGAQLAVLGKLVGQPSNEGYDDDGYRRLIRARIATNRSSGFYEQLINIAELVVNDADAYYVVSRQDVATVVFQVFGVPSDPDTIEILIKLLREAKEAGVRLLLEWIEFTPEETFTYDTGPGYDTGHYAGVTE